MLERGIQSGLDRWPLVLILMLCFALNRYAVATIESQKRELVARQLLLESEKGVIEKKIQQLRAHIDYFDKPAWQEMVIMRDLLLFPEKGEVYWFLSEDRAKQEEGF